MLSACQCRTLSGDEWPSLGSRIMSGNKMTPSSPNIRTSRYTSLTAHWFIQTMADLSPLRKPSAGASSPVSTTPAPAEGSTPLLPTTAAFFTSHAIDDPAAPLYSSVEEHPPHTPPARTRSNGYRLIVLSRICSAATIIFFIGLNIAMNIKPRMQAPWLAWTIAPTVLLWVYSLHGFYIEYLLTISCL